ncbi:MAG: DUF5050 domain-containing protein [Firmicutes bacterium]|nr:DUF5050 domain-containing protein [[Eubacterium] siraeum]MCM1487845.1 DUF5050 domain-containing protein [Bacillota bacterium]
MIKKFVSLILICGLALTACTNSGGDDTVQSETTLGTSEKIIETEADDTVIESKTETENAPLEFTGIDIPDETPESSPTYSTSMKFHTFCYSEDMVYFSDFSRGWKLYSYDGENVSLIVDKKVHYLFYFDKCIYFLSDRNVGYYDYHIDGILYKYDIESGDVTKLTDENVHAPRTDETGIYYSKEYEGKYYVYRLDEESGEEERLYEGYSYYRAGDYVISREAIGKKGEDEVYDYYLLKNDEKICFISGTTIFYDLIYGGVFYYMDWDLEMHAVDLRTGECFNPPLTNFVILNNEMYYCDYDQWGGLSLFHWQEGEAELMYTIGINLPFDNYRGNWEDHDINGYFIYGLYNVYSDGKSLYVYVCPPDGNFSELHLGKIEPLNDGSGDYVLTMIS